MMTDFIAFARARSKENEWRLKTPYGIKGKNVCGEKNDDKYKRH